MTGDLGFGSHGSERPTRIIFLESREWNGFALFNPNEFGPHDKQLALECAVRYGRAMRYGDRMIAAIRERRELGFESQLTEINSIARVPHTSVAEFESLAITGNFESMLLSTKTLLDLLATLLSHRLPNRLRGFSRHQGVIGGSVLRAIRNSDSQTLPRRDEIADLIRNHKRLWIDDWVAMRDAVTHGENSKVLVDFRVMLVPGRSGNYTEQDVLEPMVMTSDGAQPAETYCADAQSAATEFTIRLRDMVFPPAERRALLETR